MYLFCGRLSGLGEGKKMNGDDSVNTFVTYFKNVHKFCKNLY